MTSGTPFSRYLKADISRLPVINRICALLDDDGRVGDRARHYIVASRFRRAVLRGVLIALAIPLPSWAFENEEAARANRKFLSAYRQQHGLRRREARLLAATPFHQINSAPANRGGHLNSQGTL